MRRFDESVHKSNMPPEDVEKLSDVDRSNDVLGGEKEFESKYLLSSNQWRSDMKNRKTKTQAKVSMDSPIRKWLEKKGITQADFAVKVGVQTATVNGWCNNKNTDMKASNLVKIVEVTGLSMIALAEWAAHHALEEQDWDAREAG